MPFGPRVASAEVVGQGAGAGDSGTRAVHQHASLTAQPAVAEPEPRDAVKLTVVGAKVIGKADAVLQRNARRLAAAAHVQLLCVRFDCRAPDAILLGASLWPDLRTRSRRGGLDLFRGGGDASAGGGTVILLWGNLRDTPLAMVHDELRGRGASVFLLEQQQALDTELDVWIDGRAHGTIRVGREEWDLDTVTAAYPRPHDPRCLPEVIQAGEDSPVWRHAFSLHDGLNGWLEVTDALVVNRASAMAANNCKPLQAMRDSVVWLRDPRYADHHGSRRRKGVLG